MRVRRNAPERATAKATAAPTTIQTTDGTTNDIYTKSTQRRRIVVVNESQWKSELMSNCVAADAGEKRIR
jgi:hypothetical protein